MKQALIFIGQMVSQAGSEPPTRRVTDLVANLSEIHLLQKAPAYSGVKWMASDYNAGFLSASRRQWLRPCPQA